MNKLLSVLLLISLTFAPTITFGATAESVQQQIQSTNAQIQALDKEIAQYQAQISTTNKQSNTLAGLIKELTLTRSKLLKEKEQTQKKISATGLVINALETDIDSKERSIEASKETLGAMIRALAERDDELLIQKLILQDTMADASREYNSILTFNETIRDHMKEVSQEKDALSVSKDAKEAEKKNLTTLRQTLTQKQLAVEVTKKEKDTLLTETKNQEANYKKLLAERQKKRDAFEKELENYEAQLKFILNPKLLPSEGSGVLSWPLDSIYVTQLFGKTVAAKRLYTSGSHSGVDFRATVGTPVKSMGSGTVMGTGDTDIYCKGASFGKWVFIKYDNGLSSTFGHLSVIQSQAGQKVSAGDTVGLSGNTGHSTGPHLHVTVYASQGAEVKTVPSLSCSGKTFIMPIASSKAYLDPMLYLPKLATGSLKNDTPRD